MDGELYERNSNGGGDTFDDVLSLATDEYALPSEDPNSNMEHLYFPNHPSDPLPFEFDDDDYPLHSLSVLSLGETQNIPSWNIEEVDLLMLHAVDWRSMATFSWQTVQKTCGVWQCPFDTHIDQSAESFESVECVICLEEVPSTGLLPCSKCRQKTCALCFVRIAVDSAIRHQPFVCPLCRSRVPRPLYKYMQLVVDEHSSTIPADRVEEPMSHPSPFATVDPSDNAPSMVGEGDDDTFAYWANMSDPFVTDSIASDFVSSEYCLAELNE